MKPTKRVRKFKPLAERFWKKVQKSEGCWIWTGAIQKGGYGSINLVRPPRRQVAHRIAYEFCKGPIPVGLTIDHLCRNRKCVNPEHLEAVTMGENTLRGFGMTAINARKTNCPKGHPYDENNTYTYKCAAQKTLRLCRICKKQKDKEYRDKKRAEINRCTTAPSDSFIGIRDSNSA